MRIKWELKNKARLPNEGFSNSEVETFFNAENLANKLLCNEQQENLLEKSVEFINKNA